MRLLARDMEIISYVVEGGLAHRDSTGTSSVIRPGDVQRMSAGTGVRHSEYNASETEPVHFLQIWIIPERQGLKPSYEQKAFAAEEKRERFRLVGSHNGREGSVAIHQDVDLYATLLELGESVSHRMSAGRGAWVQVVGGELTVNREALRAGDGVASGADDVRLEAGAATEALLFDMGP
jgi:quercetin 2,3-dioxygenase